MIKVLYFDTNAIIKYFLAEKGSNLIKSIVDNRVSHSIVVTTSQIALYEFKQVLKKKANKGEITFEKMERIITISKPYFKRVFKPIDYKKIPGFKSDKNTSYTEICEKYKKDVKKNSYDGRHLACIINYLRFLSGESKPRVVTADLKFIKIIEAEGYKIINPEKISKEDFMSIITK